MHCKEAKILFSYYIDNELGQEKINILKKHLRDCPACCRETQQIQTIISFIQDVFVSQKIPALLITLDRKFYGRIKRGLVSENGCLCIQLV